MIQKPAWANVAFRTVLTQAIAAAGAVLAYLLHLPAPFLLGPILMVTAAALAGLSVIVPTQLRNVVFVIVGLNIGAAITPEMVASALRWPGSLVFLTVTVLALIALSAWALHRLFGMDRVAALLAAIPGHLSYVLSLSEEQNRSHDIDRAVRLQALRVLSLSVIVPMVALMISDAPLPVLPPAASRMSLLAVLLMLPLAVAIGLAFVKLRVPAALVMGAATVSGTAHLNGWSTGALPLSLTIPALVAMGSLIGTRFAGMTPRALAADLRYLAAQTGIVLTCVFCGAVATSGLLGLPLLSVFIAFSPGALETMMVMSLLLGANPAYVSAHHVARLLLLALIVPFLVAWVRRRQKRSEGEPPTRAP